MLVKNKCSGCPLIWVTRDGVMRNVRDRVARRVELGVTVNNLTKNAQDLRDINVKFTDFFQTNMYMPPRVWILYFRCRRRHLTRNIKYWNFIVDSRQSLRCSFCYLRSELPGHTIWKLLKYLWIAFRSWESTAGVLVIGVSLLPCHLELIEAEKGLNQHYY